MSAMTYKEKREFRRAAMAPQLADVIEGFIVGAFISSSRYFLLVDYRGDISEMVKRCYHWGYKFSGC